MSGTRPVLVAVDDEQMRQAVEDLHGQGSDLLFAFLSEFAAERLLYVDLQQRLLRYTQPSAKGVR
jgi:hypothetical protein